MKPYHIIVSIGRFQPPTARHAELLSAALEDADEVIVVIGSAAQPRAVPNPWTDGERAAMIRAVVPAAGSRLRTVTLRDVCYDDARWAANLRKLVPAAPAARIGLLNCGRRATGDYAALFPDWRIVSPAGECLAEEDMTTALFGAGAIVPSDVASRLPPALCTEIGRALQTPAFLDLKAEWAYIKDYRASWHAAPFMPIFVTVDAVVTHRGAVLLIRRGRRPGLGLCALPGGFIDPGETLLESALRELVEETGIAVAREALRQSLTANRVFDAPHRSLRGRTITHAFRFDLPGTLERPPVAAGDDAAAAQWTDFRDVDSREMFEDHYAMLQVMLGLD